MAGQDFAECVLDYLKTHADCATIRAHVISGASNILLSGDLTEEVLNAAVATRRADGAKSDYILAIAVQDDGEQQRDYRHSDQAAIIRLYDRGKGYANIRAVRRMVKTVIRAKNMAFTTGADSALIGCEFDTRSGHRWDRTFLIDFEALRYVGHVLYATDQTE